MKKNYKMKISYDGTRFFGWEHQPKQEMTIQGKLETVLSRMVGAPADQPVTVIGAGRTDAGVHAKEMIANVLLDTRMSEEEIQTYMNRYLPEDISVNELKVCADRFHSRFKAKGKTYCYSFWYADGGVRPTFDRKYVTVLDKRPNVDRMRKAAEEIVGMRDFKSFCGNSHMKKSTVRLVDSIEFKIRGPYIRMYIHGSGFLQNMVRIIAGTLLEVGYGKRTPESIAELIEARDRKLAGPTAPAQGLCLIQVDY